MNINTLRWLDMVLVALADARAVLACFGISQPELTRSIDAALA